MGYDLDAYFDVDQDVVTAYIGEHNLDVNSWHDSDAIAQHFSNKLGWSKTHTISYAYNQQCNLHEFSASYPTSWIRDDDRFSNRRFKMYLAEKFGKPFPECLENINWCLRTRKDALKVASALDEFFYDDTECGRFAEWLRETAEFASTYELSY